MSNYQATGTIKTIFETQIFASGFAKREFVIETIEGKYPQMLKFECVKDKVALLDNYSVGQVIDIQFDIRGSEHKERFYVNLLAWKIEAGEKEAPRDRTAAEGRGERDNGAGAPNDDEETDIPFAPLQTVFQP